MNRQIGLIERCNALYRHNAFKELGIGGCQHTYILCICNNPGISQEEIAKRIHVNKSNVTRNITSLEEAGFLYRSENPNDKRSFLVNPTEKAYEIKGKILEILRFWDGKLTEDLTIEEKEFLNDILLKVAQKALIEVGDKE
jgi:DNA-binding MarR family transcriptional regulator